MSRLDISKVFDFELWARTGRNRTASGLGPVEVKFNPWHDIHSGEFTFRNTGRFFGPSSAGALPRHASRAQPNRAPAARFGGGGASGRWDPQPSPPPATRNPREQITKLDIPQPSEPQNITITKNGYVFQIDSSQRTRDVSGTLHFPKTIIRSRTAQAKAGGPDRQPKDDGGHYIAARFDGPTDAFNHFAQARGFNRGRYRTLEDSWAKAMKEGKKVRVHIVPHYSRNSLRPDGLKVEYFIQGKLQSIYFANAYLEKHRDR